MNSNCGCVQHEMDLSVYGGSKMPFYHNDRKNCSKGHGTIILNGDQCSCYMKFDSDTSLRMITIQCHNPSCPIKQKLKDNYPNIWTIYKLLGTNKDYTLDDINTFMYDYINGNK